MSEMKIRNAIVNTAKQHMKTKANLKYKMGGCESNGVLDCSGFVRGVLREAIGMNGLGNSRFLLYSSLFVTKQFDERKPGDILVKEDNPKTKKYEGHVMICMGNNEVIDMSSSRNGIAIHTYDEDDLRKYTVRRVSAKNGLSDR